MKERNIWWYLVIRMLESLFVLSSMYQLLSRDQLAHFDVRADNGDLGEHWRGWRMKKNVQRRNGSKKVEKSKYPLRIKRRQSLRLLFSVLTAKAGKCRTTQSRIKTPWQILRVSTTLDLVWQLLLTKVQLAHLTPGQSALLSSPFGRNSKTPFTCMHGLLDGPPSRGVESLMSEMSWKFFSSGQRIELSRNHFPEIHDFVNSGYRYRIPISIKTRYNVFQETVEKSTVQSSERCNSSPVFISRFGTAILVRYIRDYVIDRDTL